jgi:hypothetical protein
MKKITLLLFATWSIFISSYAQFQHSFGTPSREIGRSVQLTAGDSGYIVAGLTTENFIGNTDATLVKTDQHGSPIWSVVYGGTKPDYFNCVRQVGKSLSLPAGYVAVGHTQSFGFGGGDAYLVRTDINGVPIFSRVYGGLGLDIAYCIQRTKIPNVGPGYIIVGETNSFSFLPGVNVYVILTDEWGAVVRSVVLGYLGNQRGYWIEPTSDGGYILVGSNTFQCGNTSTAPTTDDIYVVKLDGGLNLVWDRIIGGGPNLLDRSDVAYSVKQNPYDKSYIITGRTHSFSPNTLGEAYLLNLTSAGAFNFLLTYGLKGQEEGHSIILTRNLNDVDYVVAGYTTSIPYNNVTNAQALMFKTNSGGMPYWTRVYGLQGAEAAYEVHYANTPNQQGLVFTGQESSFGAGSSEIYLVETDFNGKSGSPCEQPIDLEIQKHQPCISEATKYDFVDPYDKVESIYKYVDYKTDKCNIIVVPPAGSLTKAAADKVNLANSKVSISPNPTKGMINLQLPEDYNESSIRIVNLQGKVVSASKTVGSDSKVDLNIGNLPKGLYLLEIRKKGKLKPEYHKILKE